MDSINDLKWSQTEKRAAREAFDLALGRERHELRKKVEEMLHTSSDDHVVWRIHDYLAGRKRDFDEKYDYRYSVLIFIFARLVREGWLTTEEIEKLGEAKAASIKAILALNPA